MESSNPIYPGQQDDELRQGVDAKMEIGVKSGK
jgi:hypothetical protein